MFSKFSFYNLIKFKTLDFKVNIGIVVFFNFNNMVLINEVQKKCLPILGLLPTNINSLLVDYPIIINSLYFHSIYFFNKILFKLIFLIKGGY